MKRFFIFIFVAGTVIAGAHSVSAQESAPMTEAHIERIRANCIEAQSTLYQLHASDALLRVDRGPLYQSMSTKLMAPLNSRITLGKYDAGSLVSITTDYEREFAAFRLNYQQYEEAMSRTLKLNCTNQPVAFYDNVVDTRQKRAKVHDSTVSLQGLIQKYEKAFEEFAKRFKEGTA
jgi:hypothetical protein